MTEEEINLHGIRASIHEPSGKFIVRSIYTYGEKLRASKLTGNEEHDLGEEGWNGKMGRVNGTHFINAFPEVIYIPAVKMQVMILKIIHLI